MSFSISCIRCKSQFTSTDNADSDGVAFCAECVKHNKKIASQVDAQLVIRRQVKPPREMINAHRERLLEARKRPKGSVFYFNR